MSDQITILDALRSILDRFSSVSNSRRALSALTSLSDHAFSQSSDSARHQMEMHPNDTQYQLPNLFPELFVLAAHAALQPSSVDEAELMLNVIFRTMLSSSSADHLQPKIETVCLRSIGCLVAGRLISMLDCTSNPTLAARQIAIVVKNLSKAVRRFAAFDRCTSLSALIALAFLVQSSSLTLRDGAVLQSQTTASVDPRKIWMCSLKAETVKCLPPHLSADTVSLCASAILVPAHVVAADAIRQRTTEKQQRTEDSICDSATLTFPVAAMDIPAARVMAVSVLTGVLGSTSSSSPDFSQICETAVAVFSHLMLPLQYCTEEVRQSGDCPVDEPVARLVLCGLLGLSPEGLQLEGLMSGTKTAIRTSPLAWIVSAADPGLHENLAMSLVAVLSNISVFRFRLGVLHDPQFLPTVRACALVLLQNLHSHYAVPGMDRATALLEIQRCLVEYASLQAESEASPSTSEAVDQVVRDRIVLSYKSLGVSVVASAASAPPHAATTTTAAAAASFLGMSSYEEFETLITI
eukprot:ANDGO_03193.mRNA.1 hypothetical protein